MHVHEPCTHVQDESDARDLLKRCAATSPAFYKAAACEPSLDPFRKLARDLVVKHRDDIIEAVADLLRTHRTLTGHQVHHVVAARAAARQANRVA